MISEPLQHFLSLIAWSEGTSTSPLTKHDGYDVMVSGVDGPSVFTDFSDHPCNLGHPLVLVREKPRLLSSAAGRYQVLVHYWNVYKQSLRLPDFSPASQDAVAVQQIRERRAIPLVESGKIRGAIIVCSNIWASFPGNDYGQGGRSMDALLDKYEELSA